MTDSRKEEVEDENTDAPPRLFGLSPLKFLAVGVVVALLSAVATHFVISPKLGEATAQSVLDSITSTSGELTATNTELVTFQGQVIEDANIEQKALAKDGEVTSPAGFVFTNGKSVEGRKHLDIYLDFSSQKSIDLVLLNAVNLRGMVESGRVELRFHPVPTGNAFTMYSAEALAETFYLEPDKAWSLMIELLKESASIDTNKSSEVLERVVEIVDSLEIDGVDSESISNGTFSSWIISVGDDPSLRVGHYPPLVYVDGRLLDPTQVNLNNSEEFNRAVLGD